MEHDSNIEAAIAASHAADRVAFRSLGERPRALAWRAGAWGFRARRWLGTLGHDALRLSERILGVVLDRLLFVLDKVLFGPYRALVRGVVAAARWVVGLLKAGVGALVWLLGGLAGLLDRALAWESRRLGARGGSLALRWRIDAVRTRISRFRRILRVLRRSWRRAIDRGWQHTRAGVVGLLRFLAAVVDWMALNLLYRPCAWLFHPHWPGGRPLLLSPALNRLAGFVLAAVALYLGGLLLAYIKTKALILHGTINTALWKADASYLANVVKIGAVHAMISLGVAMSKFVLLPVLAAARRGMKNNRYTQAIAYRYTRRRLAAERLDARIARREAASPEPPAGKPARPLKFLETLTHHIIAGTVPEVWEVKLARQRDSRRGVAGASDHSARAPAE